MINEILNKLDKVRSSGKNKWVALCPCHSEKTPSLRINADGEKILMHCFGCGANGAAVMDAIGMDVRALFGDNVERYDGKPQFNAREKLEMAALEAKILLLAAGDIRKGKPISDEDYERIRLAEERISQIVNYRL